MRGWRRVNGTPLVEALAARRRRFPPAGPHRWRSS